MYLNLAFSSFYIICDSFNHMHELEITHGYYAPGRFILHLYFFCTFTIIISLLVEFVCEF